MKLIIITNVSKDFNYQFVSNEPVTDEVVAKYLYKKDPTLKLEIDPFAICWGIWSHTLNDSIHYTVNFIEQV